MGKKSGVVLVVSLLLASLLASCASNSQATPIYTPRKTLVETPVETPVETGSEVDVSSQKVKVDRIGNNWPYGQPAETFVLNDMENLEDWVPRVSGDTSEDTVNFRYGTKGLKITSVNNAVAWGSYTFPSPVDLYEKIVTFSVYINDINNQDTLNFIFFNGTMTFSAPMKNDPPYFRDLQTGWNTISLNPEQWVLGGGASLEDLSGVTAMRITINSKVESTYELTTDMVMTSENTVERPMFTFTFDDGSETDYTYAFPILSKAGYAGVSYVITGKIENSGKLTLEQLTLLQERGWDISSHTENHAYYSPESFEIFRQELSDSRECLLSNGFIRGADHFSYPGGWNDSAIRVEVAMLYKTARINIEQRRESMPPSDAYRLKAVPVVADTSFETLKEKIDATIKSGQWLILMFQKVVPEATGQDVTPEYFQQIVDYLVSIDARVVTMSDVIE